MATGDAKNIIGRLQALMPAGWFPVGASPVRDAILAGFASMFAFIYSLLAYVKLQTRIATATDGWLDLIAADFFGPLLARQSGQSDASLRNQIQSTMFRPKNTVPAIISVITQLTGIAPTVIEPQNAADCVCFDEYQTGGFDVAGIIGDTAMPLQIFVDVTIPAILAIATPLIGGYGSSVAGYGVGFAMYASRQSLSAVQIADVYQALNSVRPVTGVIWTSITTV